jgi:hypothetical protein
MKFVSPDTAFIMASIMMVICSPILSLLVLPRPEAGEIALVIAAPWGDAAGIADRANVSEVAPESAPLGVLVALDSPQSVARLYSQGAWLVIDGKGVLDLCAT